MSSTLIEIDEGNVPLLEITTPSSTLIEIIAGIGPKGDPGNVGAQGPSGVTIINHGANPNVARPASTVVYWVGSADPVNAISTDWWDNS